MAFFSWRDVGQPGRSRFGKLSPSQTLGTVRLAPRLSTPRKELIMPTQPTIARIWRGRTRPEIADDYEAYLKVEGIPPLEKTALGVQLFREDREHESWFTTISYWPDLDAMTAFTRGEPTKVHHLNRDPEFLIELPETIQIHRIVVDRQGLR
jgi:hypothetical protein